MYVPNHPGIRQTVFPAGSNLKYLVHISKKSLKSERATVSAAIVDHICKSLPAVFTPIPVPPPKVSNMGVP